MAVAGDVLVELDVHQPVLGQGMELARLGLPRLEEAQGLGDRHLVDQNLPPVERRFGMRWRVWITVASRVRVVTATPPCGRRRRGSRPRSSCRPSLVDDLEHVAPAQDGGGDLHAAGAPAVGIGISREAKGTW